MTPDDISSASKLIDVLKAKGARSFKGFGIELELLPVEQKPEKAIAVGERVDPNARRCACGHDLDTEHNGQGDCIAGGCDPTVCVKKAT